jgi:hypothetical protein
MTWTELDSATTSPTETDIPFGPVTTKTSILGRMVVQLDNLPSQHQHYSLLPNYFNEAKDELLTLGLAMGRNILDQVPRLQNWRWADATIDGQGWLYLPERMLYLDAMSYVLNATTGAGWLAPFSPSSSSTRLLPANKIMSAEQFGLYSRTSAGFPVNFHRAGSRVEFWPTPQSTPIDYRTTVVLYGTRLDVDLVNPGDTLLMSPRMQLLAIDLAVAISMEKMGWDEAADRRTTVEGKIGRLISPGTKERVNQKTKTRVGGMP